MSIQQRNQLVAQCIKMLGLNISISMDSLQGLQGDLLLYLQQQQAITPQQTEALHYFIAYYCLLKAMKQSGSTSDVHIENLMKVRSTSLSKGDCSISLNYLEKKLIDHSVAESMAKTLYQSGVLNNHEANIIRNWTTQLGKTTEVKMLKTIGQYEIIELIGSGGMGQVYKAHHPILNKTIAIKVLLQLGDASEKATKRFFSEARMMAQLSHPNIVKIHDVGTHNKTSYIVMDFIDGLSLKELLKDGKISTRKACDMMMEITQAVEYAHKNNIVHRDLKPANLMIDGATKQIYLMDFGLAKDLNTDNDLTRSGQLLGTPKYMSPEQAEGKARRVNHLSDIYALGVIFYEMLSGVCPIQGTTQSKIMYNITHGSVKPMNTYKKNISPKLEAICLKAMAKNPDKRYSSAKLMGEDIENFLKGKATSARTIRISNHFEKNKKNYTSMIVLSIIVATSVFLGIYIGRDAHPPHTTNQLLEQKQKPQSNDKQQTPENNVKIVENTEKDTNTISSESDVTRGWEQKKLEVHNISFQIKTSWNEQAFIQRPMITKVYYQINPNDAGVAFYFARSIHKNIEESMTAVENTFWPRQKGYKITTLEVHPYTVNELEGKKARYHIVSPSGANLTLEAFYHLGKTRRLYMAGILEKANRKLKDRDKADLHKALHSLKMIEPDPKMQKITIVHSSFDIAYTIDSTWFAKKMDKTSTKMIYLYTEMAGVHVELYRVGNNQSLNALVNKFESRKLKEQKHKLIKSGKSKVNNFVGKSLIYSTSSQNGVAMFAHHFYVLDNNNLIAMYLFCREKDKDRVRKHLLSPLRTLRRPKPK